MWSYDELKLGREFRKISKPTARILAADQHNHWVFCLTGRQILLGYKGTLWSWGIDYGKRARDVEVMFLGGEKAERLFKEYNLDYVVIGSEELHRYKANEQYFSEKYKKVLEIGNQKVYSLREPV